MTFVLIGLDYYKREGLEIITAEPRCNERQMPLKMLPKFASFSFLKRKMSRINYFFSGVNNLATLSKGNLSCSGLQKIPVIRGSRYRDSLPGAFFPK